MKQFYYTYKITLLKGSLAGHYYYGQHITKNLNDGYAGSGRKVLDYYTKYEKIEGVTYVKEILHFYNDQNELNQAEYDLICDKYKTDKLCLNLRAGGMQSGRSEETKKLVSEKLKGRTFSEESKQRMSESHKGNKNHLGCKHSEESKQKMSVIRKGKTPANKGKHISEETKSKISKFSKGRHWKVDPITKKRVWYDE